MKKTLKGSITISRPMGYDKEHVSFTIKDNNSRAEFLEIRMTLKDFTKAITGQGGIPIDFIARGLEVVGKIKEQKELVFPMGEDRMIGNDKEIAAENAQFYADKGWTASKYFGSQSSFFTKDDIRYARTTQYRYVEETNETDN